MNIEKLKTEFVHNKRMDPYAVHLYPRWLNKFLSAAALDFLTPAVHIEGGEGGTGRGSLTNDGTV